MNLLQLQKGNKQFGHKVLFDEASFAVNEGEHIGVIGPNGAGKTTLFKIIVGQATLDSGDLVQAQKLKIGYLEQEAHEPMHISAEEHLIATCSLPIWEIKQLGAELGLEKKHFEVPFHQLSGGYRMRMKLLSLISQEPQLMLLDEPTNFLDLESILALESFMQNYAGAFLLISHDREFLKRTTDHTLEVEGGEITKYPGNIDDYFEQKAQMRTMLESQAQRQEGKRKDLQSFIDRFGAKATKAKQAQSRQKMLAKMQKVEIKDLPIKARIKIPTPIHTGKETLALENASLGYPEKKILSNCELRLEKGAHLGVVGFNGAGKSTFLKSLAGRLPLLSGQLKLGYQVSLSYYAQHVSEELEPQETVLQCLEKSAHPSVMQQEILAMAGSLLFSGEGLRKPVRVLSGGEKSRVALGQILLKKSPLLLLDEPTNHLDFDTVEALTEALRDYEGSVIVVSHDRGFIGRIATKILEIRDGRAEIYPGTYDDYLWSLEKGAMKDRFQGSPEKKLSSDNKTDSTSFSESQAKDQSKTGQNFRKLQADKKEVKREIAKTEKTLLEKNQSLRFLNDQLTIEKGPQVAELSKQLHALNLEIRWMEEQLMQQMEKLDLLERAESGH